MITKEWIAGNREMLTHAIWEQLPREHRLAILKEGDHWRRHDPMLGNFRRRFRGDGRARFFSLYGWGQKMTEQDMCTLLSMHLLGYYRLKDKEKVKLISYIIENPDKIEDNFLEDDSEFQEALQRCRANA